MHEPRKRVPVVPILVAVGIGAMVLTPIFVRWSQQPSDEEARSIASEAVPGVAVALERGEDTISVVVRDRDGRLLEVAIDPGDGEVLEIEPIDDDHDEGEGRGENRR